MEWLLLKLLESDSRIPNIYLLLTLTLNDFKIISSLTYLLYQLQWYFVKYIRRKIWVFFDSYFPLKAQNWRFSSYAKKKGSKKKKKKKKLYYGIFYRIYRKLSETKMLIYVAFSFLQISSVKKTKISLQNKTNSHLTVQSYQYRDIRLRCEISSKLTIKTLGRWQGVFTVNFEHISHFFPVFVLISLTMNLLACIFSKQL